MTCSLLPAAYRDLATARNFYDAQSPGLGDEFVESIIGDIDRLCLVAGVHPIVHDHHRMLATRFPFAIYYRIIDGDVLVRRVLDCRRNPQRHRDGLGAG